MTERPTPTDPSTTTSRLRTVTGNRFPRKCACGCGHAIPRDPEVRYVVDFGAARPYPAYLSEHSPDYGTHRDRARKPGEDGEIKARHGIPEAMAADDQVRVSLRRSTVEMIRGYDPTAETLDDAIEEMVLLKPPKALLEELDGEAKGPFVSREEARRRHGY